jgi:hypothetical protein
MDNRIRRNEICIIGLPRCDFVFSSTRTCFIAYGFRESSLEKTIFNQLFKDSNIHPEEAGGFLAPAQSAFCAKICSKIITSQFCIVLINNDLIDGKETPNANVNMEYGLMLGFNKYVIPFQRSSQKLPFNVAGLDTVKYNSQDFETQAKNAIDQAIKATTQDVRQPVGPDQMLELFLLTKKTVISSVNTDWDRYVYHSGALLGFNLLNDFSGLDYIFFGNFTALRPEVIIWRLQLLCEMWDERRKGLERQLALGMVTEENKRVQDEFLSRLKIWVLVMS